MRADMGAMLAAVRRANEASREVRWQFEFWWRAVFVPPWSEEDA